MTGSSPTARALRTLEILQARPGTTAEQLAQALGVTERAARRYVGILREAGIPVESARGPYGGYRLSRGVRLPPVVFTEEQALALVMAVLDGQPAGHDTGEALAKVIRALPERVGRQAAMLRDHASAAPDPQRRRPDPAIASALVAAVADRCRVIISYASSGRKPASDEAQGATSGSDHWETDVDPWAVVVRYGRWYLLCHSHHADAVRTYRVDRIGSVLRTSQGFVPPDGLDPVAVLEQNLGRGWQFPTRVVFHAPAEEVAPHIRPPMGTLEADGDRCVLTGSTSNPAMYAQEWLPLIPFPFTVSEGPELRAAVSRVAARFAAGSAPASPAQ